MIHEIAHQYLARGWAVIPISAGTKRPVLAAWQKLRLTADQISSYFKADSNIGVLLGEPSGGLVDVDLDHPLAVKLAGEFLPATGAVFGRQSKPRSHWLYVAAGATTHKRPARIGDADNMLVELRSTGCQTVFPTSVHPSGERITWDSPPEPAVVTADDLVLAVDALADEICRRLGIDPAHSKVSGPRVDTAGWAADGAERARRYVAKMPPAISGQGGHNQTFTVACELFRFGLTDSEAAAVLAEYNQRCQPPWSDHELQHKLGDARNTVLTSGEFGIRLRELTPLITPIFTTGVTAASESVLLSADDDLPDDPGPLPDDLVTVPGFISEVLAYNLDGAHRPQPVLALAGALSLLATLTGRNVQDEEGTRTNLYCIGVAGTSIGKQRAREINKAIFQHAGLERLSGSESIGSAQGIVNAVAAQPAILFQLDEFGQYLRTMGNASGNPHLHNIVPVLLRMFTDSATYFRTDAVADASKVKTIDNPHACLYATTTYDALYDTLSIDSLKGGFLSRVLIFEGDAEVAIRRGHKNPPSASIVEQAKWWGRYHPGGNLAPEFPQPLVIKMTEAARRIMDAFDLFAEQERKRLGEPIGSLWPRAGEKARKLALLYACSENADSPTMTDAAVTWAVEVCSHLTARLVYEASRRVAENRQESEVKRLARIVEDAGITGIDKTAMTRKTRWLKKRDRDEHLATLIESGEVIENKRERQGRPLHSYLHRRFAGVLTSQTSLTSAL
jgi:hypothetical protein